MPLSSCGAYTLSSAGFPIILSTREVCSSTSCPNCSCNITVINAPVDFYATPTGAVCHNSSNTSSLITRSRNISIIDAILNNSNTRILSSNLYAANTAYNTGRSGNFSSILALGNCKGLRSAMTIIGTSSITAYTTHNAHTRYISRVLGILKKLCAVGVTNNTTDKRFGLGSFNFSEVLDSVHGRPEHRSYDTANFIDALHVSVIGAVGNVGILCYTSKTGSTFDFRSAVGVSKFVTAIVGHVEEPAIILFAFYRSSIIAVTNSCVISMTNESTNTYSTGNCSLGNAIINHNLLGGRTCTISNKATHVSTFS